MKEKLVFTACRIVRGKPSRIKPVSPLAELASRRLDNKFIIISSETNWPWLTTSASCNFYFFITSQLNLQKLKSLKEEWGKLKTLRTWWARGPEEESSSRTRSPVAMWGTPRRVESLDAYVPLPTPGQPRNTHRTFLSLTSRCKGRGFWPSRDAALGSISEFSLGDKRKLRTAKQPPALNLRTRFRTAMGAEQEAQVNILSCERKQS